MTLCIYTDMVLANIMINKEYKGQSLDYDDLVYCVYHICNGMPGPIFSDLTCKKLKELGALYSEVFSVSNADSKYLVSVRRGEYCPNVDYFNKSYPSDVVKRVGALIDDYLINIYRKAEVRSPSNLFFSHMYDEETNLSSPTFEGPTKTKRLVKDVGVSKREER
jgi:hypothetical protein